jgi:hypothetical protein
MVLIVKSLSQMLTDFISFLNSLYRGSICPVQDVHQPAWETTQAHTMVEESGKHRYATSGVGPVLQWLTELRSVHHWGSCLASLNKTPSYFNTLGPGC